MKSQEYSAAEEYLGKITEQQTDRLFLVNTHHPILDALFNTKAAEATQKKISIDFEDLLIKVKSQNKKIR